jgi:hypothetical protein
MGFALQSNLAGVLLLCSLAFFTIGMTPEYALTLASAFCSRARQASGRRDSRIFDAAGGEVATSRRRGVPRDGSKTSAGKFNKRALRERLRDYKLPGMEAKESAQSS